MQIDVQNFRWKNKNSIILFLGGLVLLLVSLLLQQTPFYAEWIKRFPALAGWFGKGQEWLALILLGLLIAPLVSTLFGSSDPAEDKKAEASAGTLAGNTLPFADFTRRLAREKDSLVEVCVICHNGKVTLRNFDLAFEGMKPGCELRSLSLDDAFLRSPREKVVNNFTHLNRTLAYPPPTLQILARHASGEVSWWSAPYHYTAAADKLFSITLETDLYGLKQAPTQWVEAQLRAFRTMYGAQKTATRIIILDFDDTLADTRAQQKEAWAFMLEREKATLKLTDKTLKPTLKKVFEQVEANVNANEILQGIAPHVDGNYVTSFRAMRIAKRFELITEEVDITPAARRFLEQAVENDIMVCVSSWSSARHIREFLASKNLPITYVLGFDSELPDMQEKIVEKARHMLKLQGATGFPLSRFLYIGDADRDRDACKEIGVRFLRFDPAGTARFGETVITNFDMVFPLLEKPGKR